MSEYFIRDGKWCACEQSCNTATRKLEDGLSVYSCEHDGDRWIPEGPAWSKNGRIRAGAPGAMWFLVSGTRTGGYGGDGEPLVQQVTAERRLEWDGSGFTEKGQPGSTRRPHQQSSNGECVCQNALESYNQMLQEEEDVLKDDDEDE